MSGSQGHRPGGLRLRCAVVGGLCDGGDPDRAHPGRRGRPQLLAAIGIAIAALVLIINHVVPANDPRLPAGRRRLHVAKDNLGTVPGLVAGAALMIDYVLTVSVSVAAGIAGPQSAVPCSPLSRDAVRARRRRCRRGEPARRARVGPPLRDSHVPLHRQRPRHDLYGAAGARSTSSRKPRTPSTRPGSRASACSAAARVRLGLRRLTGTRPYPMACRP